MSLVTSFGDGPKVAASMPSIKAVVTRETHVVYRATGSGRRRSRRFDAYVDFAKAALNAKEPWSACGACSAGDTCNCGGSCQWCLCTCEREKARRWKIVKRYARLLMARDARGAL